MIDREEMSDIDAVYIERNQVVAALAKCFPSGLKKTAIEGWDPAWHNCVYIDLPTGQASWHFHDDDAWMFKGLPSYLGEWDGHSTPEKYKRLHALTHAGEGAVPVGEQYPGDHRNLLKAMTQVLDPKQIAQITTMVLEARASAPHPTRQGGENDPDWGSYRPSEEIQTLARQSGVRLAEAVEGFLSSYRALYRKPATDGIRLNAPMQPEAGALASALNDWRLGASVIASPRQDGAREGELVAYIKRQWAWSAETFGPALRTRGIIQHITKELCEIEAKPHDLSEWVDVIILAMDGFWRHGGKPEDLLPAMQAKQDKNFARQWPDWRTMPEGQAIKHDRSKDTTPPAPDEAVEAEREAVEILSELLTGAQVHNDRFPDRRIEGPLWNKAAALVSKYRARSRRDGGGGV